MSGNLIVEESSSFIIEAPDIISEEMGAFNKILEQAKSYASTPVSDFKVGAVAIGSSGKAYLGTNIEFPNQPLSQTVHAEQFAVTLARLHEESSITHIITSQVPCGHCRQFLLEVGDLDLPIIVQDGSSWLHFKLKDLLPYPFTLANGEESLFPVRQVQLDLNPRKENNELADEALYAASSAYVPYTKSWSGVSIQTGDGRIFRGSAIESAAYNPSLPALQAAFIQMISYNAEFHEIENVMFAEIEQPRASAAVGVWNLVKSLAPLSQTEFLTAVLRSGSV